ncbi:MAG TPA: endonuclease/exonuclease/phosphatase family protein [Alphaproteobacteria bacterium]|nr:endonuclease/exonuclease/phosphatase family protein [Alphaproteobacteria bacterium]
MLDFIAAENTESVTFAAKRCAAPALRILSWNLLRREGAGIEDVAALIATNQPDLVLMQEATAEIDALPQRVGGYYARQPLPGRNHGLAAWSPHPLPNPKVLRLPHAKRQHAGYPRVSQILEFRGVEIANVHLSHGQLMLRRQLAHIAQTVNGHSAVIGDFNAVGNTELAGFRDVGPKQPTHLARGVMPFRLDRCIVRGLACLDAKALRRGPSDHRPILIDLAAR